ncbi:MAG: Glu-tRNA(Gln) amidotransferase subunit GatD [Candidatus Woesearchaeota archaeon]
MAHKYVKVKWNDRILTGFLLERPQMLEQNYLVLKLDNGYNVGLKKNICEIIEERKIKDNELKNNPKVKSSSNADVTIISTGGTISSKVDYLTGGVDTKISADHFINMIPNLKKYGDLDAEILPNIMSEDIDFDYWKLLADSIYKNIEDNPVVITHGTDTMHYSSSLMNFFVSGGKYPRIFTGAQRSIDRGSSDAFLNFESSVFTSLNLKSNESLVCMHSNINDNFCDVHHGTKVRKMHSSRRDAFKSINSKPVARVNVEKKSIDVLNDEIYHDTELKKDISFDEKVAIQYIYPDMNPEVFNYYLENDYSGVILMGTGLGHIPINRTNILDKVKELEKEGIITCVTSQTIHGSVNPNVYANLRKLSKHSLYLGDMTTETAYLKLSWLLGHNELSKEEVKRRMLKNYANEISERRIR